MLMFKIGHEGYCSVYHPIQAARNSFLTVCNLLAVWLPRMQDQKSLMLHWRSFWWIVWPISATIDNYINIHLNWLVTYLSDWDSTCWQRSARLYSCTGLSHSTKIDLSLWKSHFTSYSLLYEQLSSWDCSLFSHDISLSEILGQATYRTWWKHIDPICPTLFWFPLFLLVSTALTVINPI